MAGVVGSCAVALVAVAATMVIGRTGGSSATSEPSRPSTTAAPSTTGPATAPPSGPAAAADPFPATSGFGFRPPPDPGRYRAVEQEHRRALTAALGVEVPEAQTREVVTDGRVVGFVFAHPMPETPPGVGERWATVELPGSSTGTVTADVRVAASGSNWVASWWAAPNGFVAVFGNEAALRAFLAERVPGA